MHDLHIINLHICIINCIMKRHTRSDIPFRSPQSRLTPGRVRDPPTLSGGGDPATLGRGDVLGARRHGGLVCGLCGGRGGVTLVSQKGHTAIHTLQATFQL